MMDGESYLYAIVEAGVALAGFSAIAIAFSSNGPNQDGAYSKVVIARLVERSLMASLFALLPILLFELGLSGRVVWLVSSGTLAIYGASALVRTLRRRDVMFQLGLRWPMTVLLFLVAIAVIVVQVLNAIGAILAQSLRWHMLGVTWLLATAAYTFVIYLRAWLRST
jgi:hypothetical protein